MPNSLLSCIFIFLTLSSLSILAQEKNPEQKAIQKVIQEAYVDGVFNQGDTSAIQEGFHESFRLVGQLEGEDLRLITKRDWLNSVRKKQLEGKFPRSKDQWVKVRFLHFDIVDRVASVKLEFWQGETLGYIDFIQLYKFGKQWKLINKVYHSFPSEKN